MRHHTNKPVTSSSMFCSPPSAVGTVGVVGSGSPVDEVLDGLFGTLDGFLTFFSLVLMDWELCARAFIKPSLSIGPFEPFASVCMHA